MSLPDVSRLLEVPAGLAEILSGFGLTPGFVRGHMAGPDDLRGPLRLSREASLRDETPFRALRLWMGGGVDPAAVEWMGEGLLNALLGCGLLAKEDGAIRAPFHLRPVEHLFLFSDYLGGHPDAVMGAGETTELLYQAAQPQRSCERILDLGCGAGTIALLLSHRADSVAGTDISERAILLSRLNAFVNGIWNVEFRCGDGFVPVAGERFDLIVSQPPYYPAERAGGQLFLSGGPRGDEIARSLIEGAPPRLAAEGRLLVLSSWATDAEVPHPPGTRLLELFTAVGDVPGARQSLVVLQRAQGRSGRARFEVPGECWGAIRPRRIEELLACQEWLLTGAGPVGIVDRACSFVEGGQRYLQAPGAALLPTLPVSDEGWRAWRQPETATDEQRRKGVAMGWLVPTGRAARSAPDS